MLRELLRLVVTVTTFALAAYMIWTGEMLSLGSLALAPAAQSETRTSSSSPMKITSLSPIGGRGMTDRFKIAWRVFFGGDIGPIGWCGQDGYWWSRPCRHVGVARGCGWFDGLRVVWTGSSGND